MKPQYDKAYCGPITAFKDPDCPHKETVDYDSKARGRQGKITHMREVCTNCGRLSSWARVSEHTVGGGFKYTIKF